MSRTHLLAATLLFASAAFPDDQPHPPAQLSVEKWFVGGWNCKGTELESGRAIVDTATFSMELGGFWLQEQISLVGASAKSRDLATVFIGWDGTQHVRYDFLVGGMARFTSNGFEGDTIVFAGERLLANGRKQSMKHTITKKGDRAFLSTFEVEGKIAFQETCSK
ncbi:MAG TPA: hypothetical protein VGH20_06510 [Myxococcales bacterium]|jgi:hypothetical protein